jgi:hypothetical protein
MAKQHKNAESKKEGAPHRLARFINPKGICKSCAFNLSCDHAHTSFIIDCIDYQDRETYTVVPK